MPLPWIPLAAAGIGAISQLISNASNAKEAERNRRFQERMSSTAHQREVMDLKRAGLHPMVSRNSGASTPAGDRAEMQDVGSRGISSALAAAQLQLIKAQADREGAQAGLLRTQSADIATTGASGRYENIRTSADIARLDLEQRQQLLPVLVQKARAEVDQILSSAKAAEARALLDEAALAGAKNLEALEKRLSELGTGVGAGSVRLLFDLLRILRR